MKLGFGLRVALWNAAFMLAGLAVFGGAFTIISNATAQRLFDESLLARADEAARAPGFGPGGPRGQGGFRGPQGQGPLPDNRPFDGVRGEGPRPGFTQGPGPDPERMFGPGPPRPFRLPADAPRFVDRKGKPLGPLGSPSPWDQIGVTEALRGRRRIATLTVDGQPRRVASVPLVRREGVIGAVQVAAGMEALSFARQAQLRTWWLALPIAALAALGIAPLLTRMVVGPIRQLTGTAETIAGDPLAELPPLPEGTDEMGRLGQAFRSMTERLQGLNRSLSQALEGQRRLTSDASHELRTPLTRLMLALDNARAPETSSEEQHRALDAAERATLAMQRLVQQLLTLARADADRLELSPMMVDLRVVAVDALSLSGKERDPRIRLELPDGPIMAWADPDATGQILMNLIENAARHTPADGTIMLSLRADRGTPQIWVRDTGSGIPAAQRDRVFERFARVDDGRARRDGGAGLGLAIGRNLAHAMNAELLLEPKVGPGATFFINFSPQPPSS